MSPNQHFLLATLSLVNMSFYLHSRICLIQCRLVHMSVGNRNNLAFDYQDSVGRLRMAFYLLFVEIEARMRVCELESSLINFHCSFAWGSTNLYISYDFLLFEYINQLLVLFLQVWSVLTKWGLISYAVTDTLPAENYKLFNLPSCLSFRVLFSLFLSPLIFFFHIDLNFLLHVLAESSYQ